MALFPFEVAQAAYSDTTDLYFKSVEVEHSIVEMCKGCDVMGRARLSGRDVRHSEEIGFNIRMLALQVVLIDMDFGTGCKDELIEILEKQEADGTVCY